MKRLRGCPPRGAREVLSTLTGILGLLGFVGCQREAELGASAGPSASGQAAPAAASVSSPCRSPAALTADAEASAWFPVAAGGHCVDPNADVRRYGGKGNPPLAGACASLGVECELPVRLGLERVVSVRYLDAASAQRQVTASVWSFGDPETALAYLTERVALDTELGRRPQLIDAGAMGVLGRASAAVTRGGAVALLEHVDERATPADRERRAALVLPELGRAIGARLPGPTGLPRAATLLPAEGRSLLDLRYEGFDLFGIGGVGRGARARYAGPGEPHDVVALVRADEDAADDVMVTLRKVDGARKIKQAPYGALRWRQTEGTKQPIDWVFGRKGTIVLGVGTPVVVVLKRKGAPKPPDRSLLRLKVLLDRTAGR